MTYKTILVNAAPSPRAGHIAACAARLAIAQQSHLVGLASTGINPLSYQCNAAAPGVPMRQQDLDLLTAMADEALAGFTATVTRLGAPSSEVRRTDDDLGGALIGQARYCDLVVVGQTEPVQRATPAGVALPEELVLHGPRPVLVLPHSGEFAHVGARPLLAWDGGMAACRAFLAALPLLSAAPQCTLAVFNPTEVYDAHGPQPGADQARYLARHGVKLDVVVRQSSADLGEALLSLAADCGADLLVMGCYGHTRFRELLLGGVTRTILRDMTLPVLMTR